MSVKWIFFDIGDVLFSEDAPHALYFHSLLQAMRRRGIEVGWDQFHAQLIASVKQVPNETLDLTGSYFVPDKELWGSIFHEGRTVYEAIRKPRPYGVLLDDITPVIHQLREFFRLGIIANQHVEILDALQDYGIDSLFDIKVIDQDVGVSKPDPAIFRLALEKAGCRPDEAIMVGDRPDNDIVPAKSCGMKTVRFRRGVLYSHYDPLSEAEVPDVEVRAISKLAAAIMDLARDTSN